MATTTTIESTGPVKPKERSIILDALRGLALLGICLANFPEFSLYTFLKSEVTDGMPTAGIDRIVRFLQYVFVDGKFYTLFSLLFGIGFSIIISNAAQRGNNGFPIFYRRMGILLLIGFLHLMFLWSGDILMLYALLGLLLPLFRNLSNRGLLIASVFILQFMVMGLFLLGFYIGRNRIYAHLAENKWLLKRVSVYGALIGLPASLLYAWSSLGGHPWGLAVHSVLYTLSVFPLGLAYAAAFCLWYLRHKESCVFKVLAAPGQMALSNYIGQSLWGILVFYGIGFGLGSDTGLVYVLGIATGAYVIEIIFSLLWL